MYFLKPFQLQLRLRLCSFCFQLELLYQAFGVLKQHQALFIRQAPTCGWPVTRALSRGVAKELFKALRAQHLQATVYANYVNSLENRVSTSGRLAGDTLVWRDLNYGEQLSNFHTFDAFRHQPAETASKPS
ncbi:hypothetical protein LP414_09295 [Polaromonas sp. P1(28)-13]|nr:hypothetical protein LP414_09295 [Polaromonas sp. P1(28)-13]